MITSFFNSIQALISLYKDGSLGLANVRILQGRLARLLYPFQCPFIGRQGEFRSISFSLYKYGSLWLATYVHFIRVYDIAGQPSIAWFDYAGEANVLSPDLSARGWKTG